MDTHIPEQRFPSYGCCIYCRSVEVTGEEHVIPRAMQGNYIIDMGSCDPCAKHINKNYEQYVLRTVLGPHRLIYKYRSRNPKNQPKMLPLELYEGDREWVNAEKRAGRKFELKDFGSPKIVYVPIADYPIAPISLPEYERPGIVVQRIVDDEQFAPRGNICFGQDPHDYEQRVQRIYQQYPGHCAIGIDSEIDYLKFARWLAKIAHGLAVIRFGLDGFEPYLIPIIRHQSLSIGSFVGTFPSQMFSPLGGPNRRAWRKADTVWSVGPISIAAERYVWVRLQFFKTFGAPVYEVIAGRIVDQGSIPGGSI